MILRDIGLYGPAELSDLARVFTRLALAPAPLDLFEALAAQTVRRIDDADIQQVLRWVWVCGCGVVRAGEGAYL